MSWHKTTFPSTSEDHPDVLNAGRLATEAFMKANKPQGFGMFHAKRGVPDAPGAILIVYVTPVASEVCTELFETYKFEPCEAPFTGEQNMAYVLGDPWSMTLLQETRFPVQPTAEELEAQAAAAAAEAEVAQTEETQTAQTDEAPQAQAAS